MLGIFEKFYALCPLILWGKCSTPTPIQSWCRSQLRLFPTPLSKHPYSYSPHSCNQTRPKCWKSRTI